MTEDIINYCKDKFNVLIGETQAENAKINFANVNVNEFGASNKEHYRLGDRNLKWFTQL